MTHSRWPTPPGTTFQVMSQIGSKTPFSRIVVRCELYLDRRQLHSFCHLDPAAEQARTELKIKQDVSLLTAYLSEQLAMPPLETVAKVCNELSIGDQVGRNIFDNYDRFLGILDDQNKRDELAKATTHADLRDSAAWREIRDVSTPFHDGLVTLFLASNKELTDLTMKYGVF